MRHRLDGPAVEKANGTREWWVNGRERRLDGPAIEWADGDKEWFVKGKLIGTSKEGFTQKKFELWKKRHRL